MSMIDYAIELWIGKILSMTMIYASTHPNTSINAAQLPDYLYFVSSANFQGNKTVKTVSNRGINAFRTHAERANQ